MNQVFEMPRLEVGFRADIVAAVEAMPASQLIDLKVLGLSPAGISLNELPIRTEFTFDGRIVQAGIVGMLADYAGVMAANCNLPLGWMSSTTGYEVHNVAPAMGDALVAIGRVVHVGKSSAISSAQVWARRGNTHTLVAWATTSCNRFELKPHKPS